MIVFGHHVVSQVIDGILDPRFLGIDQDRNFVIVSRSADPVNPFLNSFEIRVPPIEVIRATWETLGAKPVVMGLSDIYMGLSRGQLDGQENGFDAIIGFKWYEVTKNYSPLNQVYEVSAYYMNEKLWQGLTPQERDILKTAAKLGGESMTKAGDDLARDGLETLKKAGVVISEPDRAAFQDALKEMHKKYDGKLWPAGLVEKIKAMQQ